MSPARVSVLFVTLVLAPDRRRLEAEPDLVAHEEALGFSRELVAIQVALARRFARLEATRTFVHFGAASMAEYGVYFGLSWCDTRRLVDVAHALDRPVSGGPEGARPMT